jgi:integrating conjugative element protein (TIGR03756 family)
MKWVSKITNSQLKTLLLCLILLSFPARAVNNCLQFTVVGICYWYYYYGSETTILYGHFNPDVIVDITNPQGVDRVEAAYRTDSQDRNHNNLIYQDASSYGHPLTGQIYCPSNTDALSPYFLSTLDTPSWRWGGLDMFTAAAWIPGLREIGDFPLNTWGAVYPRTGWTIQHSEPKSSGIVAQRVGDIITRDSQPHIYRSILGDSVFVEDEKIVWSPDSLDENTSENGWWQITQLESSSGSSALECLIFGENDTASSNGWGGGKVQQDGEYRYTLWRPYTCCEVGTGVLIKIPVNPFPNPVITN